MPEFKIAGDAGSRPCYACKNYRIAREACMKKYLHMLPADMPKECKFFERPEREKVRELFGI